MESVGEQVVGMHPNASMAAYKTTWKLCSDDAVVTSAV